MARFSKFKDVQAVLCKSEQLLLTIEAEYQEALNNKEVTNSLLVDVKNYLENLRSALEYLWNKIPAVKGSYFPITNSKADFKKMIIGIDPKVSVVLEKWQPYNGQDWIKWFKLLNNKNKHLTLVPQIKKEGKEFTLKRGNAGMVFKDCAFMGDVVFGINGKAVHIDQQTQMLVDTPGVEIERVIWNDFVFDCGQIIPKFPENIKVLPFLLKCLENIQHLVLDIEKSL